MGGTGLVTECISKGEFTVMEGKMLRKVKETGHLIPDAGGLGLLKNDAFDENYRAPASL